MKNIITLSGLLLSAVALAQPSSGSTGTTNAAPTANAQMQTTQSTAQGKEANHAGAGGSLVVPGATDKTPEKRAPQRIPNGSYGTNRTNEVYSPSNPNYPYDVHTGKLIQSPGVQILHSKNLSPKASKVNTEKTAMTAGKKGENTSKPK